MAERLKSQDVNAADAKFGIGSVAGEILSMTEEARANPKTRASQLWARFLQNPTGEVGKTKAIESALKDIRLGAIVGLIETGNLAKLLAWDVAYSGKHNFKTVASALASALSVASAVADIGSVVAKSVYSSDAWNYQRLKLWGGGLSCGATIVGAVVDGNESFNEYFKKDRKIFVVLYATKAALGVLSATATVFTTLTYAQPLAARLLGKAAAGKFVTAAGKKAAWLVARRVLFMSIGGWVTATIFAVQILILVLDDDALVKWCARSAFGVDFAEDPYSSGPKQVDAFHSALTDVNSLF